MTRDDYFCTALLRSGMKRKCCRPQYKDGYCMQHYCIYLRFPHDLSRPLTEQ